MTNNKISAFSEQSMDSISELLRDRLKQNQLAYYEQAKLQPVVPFDSEMWKFVKTKELTKGIPKNISNAVDIAKFILALSESLPNNISTLTLSTVDDENVSFGCADVEFQVTWTEYTTVTKAEADAIATVTAKNTVSNFAWRCIHQVGYKQTNELMAFYKKKYPECFLHSEECQENAMA